MYYEVGGTATEASLEVEKLNDFTTNELKLSFLCVDSSGEHGTGEPINWTNGVKVLYKIQDTAEETCSFPIAPRCENKIHNRWF